MENLFPYIDARQEEATNALPLYKEVAWDFKNNIPIIVNGNFKYVLGHEAVQVWAFKALNTSRFRHLIYSWDFGHEFDSMIGQVYTNELVQSEAKRFIEEALLINPYIDSISNILVKFNGDKVSVDATLSTIYGEVRVDV